MTIQIGTNLFEPSRWIVNPTSGSGTQTTIASALTAASSGDTIFIMPGTYTENLTLKAGVDLVAWIPNGYSGNVIINGNCTFSTAGTVTISGIRLQTNSGNCVTVSGSVASILNLQDCYINCSNNTGISYSSSSASSGVFIFNSRGDIGTTGIALFSSSGVGQIKFINCSFTNTGSSSTASTASAGTINAAYSGFPFPITTSSTAAIALHYCIVDGSGTNTIALTHGGSGASEVNFSYFGGGTASSISVGATLTIVGCEVNSSNANPITGAGTINYTPVNFSSTGQGINTTTRTPLNYGTWTPTLTGASVAGTTTYTTQQGYYTIVGNIVYIEGVIVITAATGTGTALVGNFPFTVKNLSNYIPVGSVDFSGAGWAWSATPGTMIVLELNANTTNGSLVGTKSSAGGAVVSMTNSAATVKFNAWYQI